MIHKKFSAVVIGIGSMGKNHLRVLNQHPGFELVGVVDPYLNDEICRLYPQIKVLPNVDNLECDCVIIASPTSTHFDIASKIMSKRIPCLIEKPLCLNSEECFELIKFNNMFDGKSWVGHLERFNPAIIKLKRLIKSGVIGRLVHLSFTRVGSYPNNPTQSGNVLLDLAVHDVDVFQYLSGEAEVVGGVTSASFKRDIIDTADILLKTKTGVIASISSSWVTPTKIRSLRATGTRGVCFVDYILQTCTLLTPDIIGKEKLEDTSFLTLVKSYPHADKIEFHINKEEPLKCQYDAFYDELNDKKSELCTLEEAYSAINLVEQSFSISNSPQD